MAVAITVAVTMAAVTMAAVITAAVIMVVMASGTLTVAGITAGCGLQPGSGVAAKTSVRSAMRRYGLRTSAMR
ncbi:hypothetical protein [Bradyrhizobium liaoningense]|uniref:hypothetical protein n=1 Tax=Bradyrhizobium liaoningense TaxID=43992 RepID=UPI0020139400|nr:hypothetical protein [Bradyrhizobium liaoningense]